MEICPGSDMESGRFVACCSGVRTTPTWHAARPGEMLELPMAAAADCVSFSLVYCLKKKVNLQFNM